MTLRVAIVHYDASNNRSIHELVRALAGGIQGQGHDVTLIDACREVGVSLTSFAYIVVGVVADSLMSKSIPEPLVTFLRSAGHLSGKRSYAFVAKGGLRKRRVLSSLMKAMEMEGMFLKKSDILVKSAEAAIVGSRLHINRP